MYPLLRFIPKNHLSHFVGWLVHLRLPRPLARPLVRAFAKAFDIDMSIATKELDEYPSIGHLFTRDLKPGSRTIEGDLVSPVDGVLRNWGFVTHGRLEQVKGRDYSLETFLGHDAGWTTFADGIYFNFYLSPQDYHHVHSPVSGRIVRSTHIPGRLWPVNDWSMRSVESLFAVNERVVTWIDSKFGQIAVVMIGATNVGKMSVVYDAFITNVPPRRNEIEHHVYDQPREISAGDRLGTFHMGSSVVVIVPRSAVSVDDVTLPQPVRVVFGQSLLRKEKEVSP